MVKDSQGFYCGSCFIVVRIVFVFDFLIIWGSNIKEVWFLYDFCKREKEEEREIKKNLFIMFLY